VLNKSHQPTLFRHLSHLDPAYQRWGDQIKEVTMTSYIPQWFVRSGLEGSVFTPQMELVVGTQLASLWLLGTVFVGYTCAENYHLQLYHSSTLCMLHRNFYSLLSCYISWTHPGVRCLYRCNCNCMGSQPGVRRLHSCCYVTWVLHWLRLAVCKGPNRVGVLHSSPEDRNRTSFRNDVFSCVLNSGGWTSNFECYNTIARTFQILLSEKFVTRNNFWLLLVTMWPPAALTLKARLLSSCPPRQWGSCEWRVSLRPSSNKRRAFL
jgi:hypothetical protein